MTHEVFSHDPYLCALTYHFPIPCNSEDNNHHDVNQHNNIPYGIRQGKDKTTK